MPCQPCLPGSFVRGIGTRGLVCDGATIAGGMAAVPPGSLPQHFEPDTCPKRTVNVFDWDDTLCPASATRCLGITPLEPPLLSAQTCLRELVLAAMNLLMAALLYSSKMVIVTNVDGFRLHARLGCPSCCRRSDSVRLCLPELIGSPARLTSKQDWNEGHSAKSSLAPTQEALGQLY